MPTAMETASYLCPGCDQVYERIALYVDMKEIRHPEEETILCFTCAKKGVSRPDPIVEMGSPADQFQLCSEDFL